MLSTLVLLWAVPTPDRTLVDDADALALVGNPAGLSRVNDPELHLVAGRDHVLGDNGIGLFGAMPIGSHFRVGLGLEVDRLSDSPWLGVHAGVAASLGLFELGTVVARGADGVRLSAGASLRPTSWLATGLVVQDLAQVDGPRIYELGLGVRPFGDRYTFSVSWQLRQGAPIDFDEGRPKVDGRISAEILDGLWVSLASDLNLRASLEIGLSFPSFGGAIFAGTAKDGDGLGAFGGLVTVRQHDEPALFDGGRVAMIELTGDLRAQRRFEPLRLAFTDPAYGEVPLALRTVRDDPSYDALVVRIGALDVGFGVSSELRDAILEIRGAGKPTVCVLHHASDREYFVASACDTIIAPPALPVLLNGVSVQRLYFADAFERFGVSADVVAVGRYKSAAEPLLNSAPSPEARASAERITRQTTQILVGAIARSRGLDESRVNALMLRGILTAEEAVASGLVDELLQDHEIDGYLERRFDTRDFDNDIVRRRRAGWERPGMIAMVAIEGPISQEVSAPALFSSRSAAASTLIETLERLGRDDRVRAVVLRVESPGGSALASDRIAAAVQHLATQKPVVASLGDIAASGGYYVASRATKIFAEPTTLTGSIGVLAIRLTAHGLLGELGVNSVELARQGEPVDAHSPVSRPMNERERQIWQQSVDATYQRFVEVVAEGRSKPIQKVRELAQGRLFTGTEALNHGLVDAIGGLADAVAFAKEAAGISGHADLRLEPRARQTLSEGLSSVSAAPLEEIAGNIAGPIGAGRREPMAIFLGLPLD